MKSFEKALADGGPLVASWNRRDHDEPRLCLSSVGGADRRIEAEGVVPADEEEVMVAQLRAAGVPTGESHGLFLWLADERVFSIWSHDAAWKITREKPVAGVTVFYMQGDVGHKGLRVTFASGEQEVVAEEHDSFPRHDPTYDAIDLEHDSEWARSLGEDLAVWLLCPLDDELFPTSIESELAIARGLVGFADEVAGSSVEIVKSLGPIGKAHDLTYRYTTGRLEIQVTGASTSVAVLEYGTRAEIAAYVRRVSTPAATLRVMFDLLDGQDARDRREAPSTCSMGQGPTPLPTNAKPSNVGGCVSDVKRQIRLSEFLEERGVPSEPVLEAIIAANTPSVYLMVSTRSARIDVRVKYSPRGLAAVAPGLVAPTIPPRALLVAITEHERLRASLVVVGEVPTRTAVDELMPGAAGDRWQEILEGLPAGGELNNRTRYLTESRAAIAIEFPERDASADTTFGRDLDGLALRIGLNEVQRSTLGKLHPMFAGVAVFVSTECTPDGPAACLRLVYGSHDWDLAIDLTKAIAPAAALGVASELGKIAGELSIDELVGIELVFDGADEPDVVCWMKP